MKTTKKEQCNTGKYSAEYKKPVKANDTVSSYSFRKKTPSKSSSKINRPVNF